LPARPRWRADGRELFYRAPFGVLMAVAFSTGDRRPGIPRNLFRPPGAWWDASSDGSRFLAGVPVQQATPPFIAAIN
jgi:hypothetical protein